MRKRVLFLLLMAFALSARPASAEPLQITSGAFLLDIEGDLFRFSGDGFTVTTIGPDGLSPVQPDGLGIYSTKLFPGRCDPTGWPFQFCAEAEGARANWSFQTTGGEQLLGKGNVVLDGLNAINVDFVGSMRFDVVPTAVFSGGQLEGFGVLAPFSFEAMIRGLQGGDELFAQQFIGSGLVRVPYEALSPGFVGLNADTDTIRYQFAEPVPEPGTLLLLGSGLGAALLRRGRRKT